jgi:predicted permease
MRAHLEEYADQLVARGLTPEAARREARLKFGNPRVKLEEVEAMSRTAVFEPLWRDVRYAARGLHRSPGFTAVVVAVLALGIGTATAIFSVVDAVVLRGLPFPDAHRIVDVSATRISDGSRPTAFAAPDALDYRALQDVFDGLAATAFLPRIALQEGGQSELLDGARFTADLFHVLRVRPQLGRQFAPEHEVNGNHNVAVISDGLWRRRFGADPGIVGRTIALDRARVEVLGVMPPGFDYPAGDPVNGDIWMPLVFSDNEKTRGGAIIPYTRLAGRLKPGVTLDQAQARMEQITRSLAAAHPGWFGDQGILVRPLRTTVAGGDRIRSWMLMLLAAVGCVLLLTCVNVGNLMVARATARGREGRIRAALGASRWQLARGAVVEGLLVAAIGSALGVLMASWGIGVLRAAIPTTVPLVSLAALDARVLVIAGAVTIVLGAMLGALPAFQLASRTLVRGLRAAERTQTPTAGTHRTRAVLLIAEVALAVILLVGAGLFASSFIRVMSVDLGMDYQHVVRVNVSGQILDPVIERLSRIPGVEAVGALDQNWPFSLGGTRYSLTVAGRSVEYRDRNAVRPHWVTPGYFPVMRLPVLGGRAFNAADTAGSAPVALLSMEAARRYFADRDPIGSDIEMGAWRATVVGIVGGMRLAGPESDFAPEIYFPATQKGRPLTAPAVLVRTGPDPYRANVIPHIKTAIWSIAPTQTLAPITLAEQLVPFIAPRRFNMVILTMFGVMGTIIAAIGIYGVMAFIVAQRTQEVGIRIALGAQPGRVRRSVLWSASRLLVAGLAIGLATAAALAGRLEGLLFQVEPRDGTVYAAASLVLLAAGLLAAYLPARRASRVDPLIALRAE